MKTCQRCRITREDSQFRLQKRGSTRRRNVCKVCAADEAKARRTQITPEMRERYRVAGVAYRAANRERLRSDARERYARDPSRRRAQDRALKYGLTAEEFAAMRSAQANACAVCDRPQKADRFGVVRDLSVDHCHASGEVRGLLCSNCNTAIGLLGDDPERARALATYLEAYMQTIALKSAAARRKKAA